MVSPKWNPFYLIEFNVKNELYPFLQWNQQYLKSAWLLTGSCSVNPIQSSSDVLKSEKVMVFSKFKFHWFHWIAHYKACVVYIHHVTCIHIVFASKGDKNCIDIAGVREQWWRERVPGVSYLRHFKLTRVLTTRPPQPTHFLLFLYD